MSRHAKLRSQNPGNPRIFFRYFHIFGGPLWRHRSPRSLGRFCSYLESSQILLGENDFWDHHPPPPLPATPREGGSGLSESENVDPNRNFQNSDLSIVMVSGTSCVVYGTHKPSRRHLSAVDWRGGT